MKQLCSSDKKCVFIDNMCLHEDALQLIDNKFDCLHFAKTIPASAFPHHLQYLKKTCLSFLIGHNKYVLNCKTPKVLLNFVSWTSL